MTMVSPDSHAYCKKLRSIQEGLISESSTLSVIFAKCKSKLPNNKLMGTVSKVQKELKILNTLDFTGIMKMKNAQRTSETIEFSEWNQVLQDCIHWGRVAISSSDACLIAFAHCEQNIKIGHFLMYYVSILAILARLHTLTKALCLTIGQFAYEIKLELQRTRQSKNLDGQMVEAIKKELLEDIGFPNGYERLLEDGVLGDFNVSVNKEDLGEPISRMPSQESLSGVVPIASQTTLEAKLEGANSVRALRLACKEKALSPEVKSEVERILQRTDSMCRSLLEAKRSVIQQSAQLLTSLITNSKNSTSRDFLVDFQEQDASSEANGKHESPEEVDKLSICIKDLLYSLPCKKKMQKLSLPALSNVCTKKKRHLIKMIKKVKPKLVDLKLHGNFDGYQKQVSMLVKRIKKAVSAENIKSSQGLLPSLDESDLETPLLETSQQEVGLEESGNMPAFEKFLKSCQTVDGLLDAWNDIVANRREDLTALLPPKIKRSKLMCVKNNIMKLKKQSHKQNFKTTVRKIAKFLYK